MFRPLIALLLSSFLFPVVEAQEGDLDELMEHAGHADRRRALEAALTDEQRRARAEWQPAIAGFSLGVRLAEARRACAEVSGSWERGRDTARCSSIPDGVRPPLDTGPYPMGHFDGVQLAVCRGRVCGMTTSSTGLCSRDGTGPLIYRALADRLGPPNESASREGGSVGSIATVTQDRSWELREGLEVRLLWVIMQVGVGRTAAARRECTTVFQIGTGS